MAFRRRRPPYLSHPDVSDPEIAQAAESERRRSIAYRGPAEAVLFVLGAVMAVAVAIGLVIGVARAVL